MLVARGLQLAVRELAQLVRQLTDIFLQNG
jgi:hypothetical protein